MHLAAFLELLHVAEFFYFILAAGGAALGITLERFTKIFIIMATALVVRSQFLQRKGVQEATKLRNGG